MKKLMIALSAAAVAFGLRAADGGFLAGTDFEDGNVPSTGWTIPEDDPNQSLVNVAETYQYSGNVPTQWTDSDHTKFLSVKTTFGKPISLDYEQDMSDGAYFDSLVKMTVCDEAPAADYANAKIMVWAQENAEGTATSLWVRASAPDGEGWKSQDFECGAFAKADEWHRLTIKAIPDIYKAAGASDYVPGFVVYVDGQPISSVAAQLDPAGLNANAAQFNVFGQLFVSLDQDGTNKNKITAVGFDGQGSLDDVTLTSTAPSFAVDYEFFTVQGDNNVVSFKANGETSKDGVVQLEYTADMTVQLSEIVFAEGYMLDELSGDTDVECDTDALTFVPGKPNLSGLIKSGAAAAEFNGKPYASVDEAVEAANAIDVAGTYTLKLFANADSTITFANENPDVKIEIDLAGKTVKGEGWSIVVEAGDVTIVDSVGGGKVETGTDGAVMVAGGALFINAGMYDGLVAKDEGTLSIYDGSFLASANEKDALAACITRDGYTLKKEGDYYVVAKDGWTLYLAEGENGEFLIQDEDDLLALATHLNESAAFGSAGITFKQTADITLTGTFPGIGLANAKDEIKAPAFKSGAFQGIYDGQDKAIKGLILGVAGKLDYIGLFNSCWNATIKNLKVGLGNATGWDASGDQVGAVIAGVTGNTTIENVETIVDGAYDTFKAAKTAAGIVGYAAGGTVLKGCVNNLNIESANNEKCAGLIACAQDSGSFGGGIEIDSCENHGNITCDKADCVRSALLVSYCDVAVTFKGNIVAEGTVTQAVSAGKSATVQSVISLASGSAAVADGAVIKVPADIKTVNKAVDGLNYATVDGDVATLVKDADLAAGKTYKVMTAGNTPTIELKEAESITFNTELATIEATGITAESGCKIEATGLGSSPITYTAVKAGGWNPDADPTVPAADIPGLPAALKVVSLAQLSKWAQAKGVDFNDAGSIIPEAFLLNCANDSAAVEEAKANFKFTAFDPANPPTAEDFAAMGYNGTVTIKSFSDAACTTEAIGGDQLFYKAILTPTPAPVKE